MADDTVTLTDPEGREVTVSEERAAWLALRGYKGYKGDPVRIGAGDPGPATLPGQPETVAPPTPEPTAKKAPARKAHK